MDGRSNVPLRYLPARPSHYTQKKRDDFSFSAAIAASAAGPEGVILVSKIGSPGGPGMERSVMPFPLKGDVTE